MLRFGVRILTGANVLEVSVVKVAQLFYYVKGEFAIVKPIRKGVL